MDLTYSQAGLSLDRISFCVCSGAFFLSTKFSCSSSSLRFCYAGLSGWLWKRMAMRISRTVAKEAMKRTILKICSLIFYLVSGLPFASRSKNAIGSRNPHDWPNRYALTPTIVLTTLSSYGNQFALTIDAVFTMKGCPAAMMQLPMMSI